MFGLFQFVTNDNNDYYYFTLTGKRHLLYSFAIDAYKRIAARKAVYPKAKAGKKNKTANKAKNNNNRRPKNFASSSLDTADDIKQLSNNENPQPELQPFIAPTYNMAGDKNIKDKEILTMEKGKRHIYSKEQGVNPERLDLIRSRTKKKALANVGKNPYFGTFTVDKRLHDACDCMRHFKNFREGCRRRLGWVPPYIMTIAETDSTHHQHIHILLLETTKELLEEMPLLWTVGNTKLEKIPEINQENHIRACINYIYKNAELTLKVNPKMRRTVFVSKNLKKPNRTEVFTKTDLSNIVCKLYDIQKKYNLDTPNENIVKIQDENALHIGFCIPKEKYKQMDKSDIETLVSIQALNINYFKQAINGKLTHSDYYLMLNHLYVKNIYKIYLKEAYNTEYKDIANNFTQEILKKLVDEVYKMSKKLPNLNELTTQEAIISASCAFKENPEAFVQAITKKQTKRQFKSAIQNAKKLDKLFNRLKSNLWTKYQPIFTRFSEKILDIIAGLGYIIK